CYGILSKLLLCSLLIAFSSQALITDKWINIVHKGTSKCVNVQYDNGVLVHGDCETKSNSQWKITETSAGSGQYYITNRNNNYMELVASPDLQEEKVANWPQATSVNSKWTITAQDCGGDVECFEIKNIAAP